MRVYTYSEARQNLASLLEQAIREGEIQIKRKVGRWLISAVCLKLEIRAHISGPCMTILVGMLISLLAILFGIAEVPVLLRPKGSERRDDHDLHGSC